jgi:hypothetical protein
MIFTAAMRRQMSMCDAVGASAAGRPFEKSARPAQYTQPQLPNAMSLSGRPR